MKFFHKHMNSKAPFGKTAVALTLSSDVLAVCFEFSPTPKFPVFLHEGKRKIFAKSWCFIKTMKYNVRLYIQS